MRVKDLQELAKIIALAQDFREESFVHPDRTSPRTFGHYTCSEHDAAIKAAAQVTNLSHEHVIVEEIAQLVYLLNYAWWNDMQVWTAEILKLPEGE